MEPMERKSDFLVNLYKMYYQHPESEYVRKIKYLHRRSDVNVTAY